MKNNPQITVLMPAYNAESFIEESIQSIMDQSFKDFILLIIDDASEDKTLDIIHKFQQKDTRIQLLKNEENLGVAGTLNRGLQNINTSFIARMDSDDISHPQRLEKQFNFMQAHPDIGVCGTYIEQFGEKEITWKMPAENNLIKASLLWENSLAHPTIFMRTDLLIKNNIKYGDFFNHSFMQDYTLWINLLPFTKFANIPEVLLKRRVHKNNQTIRFISNRQEQLFSIYKWLFQKFNLNVTREEINIHLIQTQPESLINNKTLKKYKNWQEKLKNHFSRFDFMESKAIEEVNQKKWKMLMDKIPFYNFPLLIDYLNLSENKPELFKLFLKKKIKKLLSW